MSQANSQTKRKKWQQYLEVDFTANRKTTGKETDRQTGVHTYTQTDKKVFTLRYCIFKHTGEVLHLTVKVQKTRLVRASAIK